MQIWNLLALNFCNMEFSIFALCFSVCSTTLRSTIVKLTTDDQRYCQIHLAAFRLKPESVLKVLLTSAFSCGNSKSEKPHCFIVSSDLHWSHRTIAFLYPSRRNKYMIHCYNCSGEKKMHLVVYVNKL